ncbi:hypothetical protein J7I93_00400 [Bacillus sp. ISL-47]|uniref:DUF6944 family repetitive protein n=1 Tax=Bacillus sp. ISL-47 TaxID=2819130 RepID=UPI001BECA19C|nr:hypothetical protein [Bacillus sp. ISL-47]MBT2686636.1 hypothetical protein [Bacillus sp. ISL-47]MBT2707028.1 hypothetical protein [Pseudomonas sp. ISL-84]
MDFKGEEYLSIGSYFLVIGTLISALGETVQGSDLNDFNKKLIRDGNAVQALGNSLQGFGRIKLTENTEEESHFYGIIGSFIQAGGNTMNSAAVNLEIVNPSASATRINALGSSVQSIGAALEAEGAANREGDYFNNLEVLGSSLISIATMLDSAGILIRDEMSLHKRLFLATGGWLEFIGASIGAYAINKRDAD